MTEKKNLRVVEKSWCDRSQNGIEQYRTGKTLAAKSASRGQV